MAKTVQCESCGAINELRKIEVRPSQKEGFWGHRPTRCWCPNCGSVLHGVQPEAVEISNPKAWLVFGALIALIATLVVVPRDWFEPLGLLVLAGVGVASISYGKGKHKVWGGILLGVCIYLIYELPKAT